LACLLPILQAAFGTRPSGKIENWSLKIGHWQLNTTTLTAQLPFTNFQFSIAFKGALFGRHAGHV
jgi:hypothetical protein